MEQGKGNYLVRTIRSFGFAFRGLGFFFSKPSNAWIHLVSAILACSAGFYLDITKIEWIAILFAIALVFVSEMLNSALETTIDLISPEFNEFAGRAKDIAAGAVLIAALIALIIGGLVFIPKLL